MKITHSRAIVDGTRAGSTATIVAGPSAAQDQITHNGALRTIAVVRVSTAAKRGVSVARLESQVRGGDYVPDAVLVANEVLADADMRTDLKSLLRH